jgi:hypothetical protein
MERPVAPASSQVLFFVIEKHLRPAISYSVGGAVLAMEHGSSNSISALQTETGSQGTFGGLVGADTKTTAPAESSADMEPSAFGAVYKRQPHCENN